MSQSWGVVPQPTFETSWESPMSKSNNLQAETWERPSTSENWGNERPAASAPSENNLNARKAVQGSWGQNKSENSWAMRNDDVQVDRSTWQRKEEPRQRKEESPVPTYKSIKRENEEEKFDVGIQQSFESLRNDDYDRQKDIILDEEDYDPSYNNFPTSSKQQLGKSIVTPFDDEIQFNNTSDMYNVSHVEPLITSSNSTFKESPNKEFRNVGVQTDPINLAAISASNEKLLSCTISSQIKKEYQQTSQDLSKSATSSVSEKRYPPQQPSLLDVDPDEWNAKVANTWNKSSGNPNFREGTAAIPHTRSDSSSRGEVTQLPKPNSDSWDNKPTLVQNDSWNTNQRTSARNDNRGSVPQSIPVEPDSWDSPQTSTRNDNRGTVPQPTPVIPVEPDSWDSPQTSTRNDNRGTVPQSIPVQPDSWDSPQTSTRNDNRGTVPKTIPVQPDSWDSPQTSARNDNRGPVHQQIPVEPDSWDSTRNDNRGTVPQSIPVQPDSWDSGPQSSAQNDNRRLNPQPTPVIPVEPDSWDSTSQTRNDNRGTVPRSIPVQPDSWDSGPQTSAQNDNRRLNPQPAPVIPVQPDSWDSGPQTSAQNDNRRLNPQPTPVIPVEPDSWDSGPKTSAPSWKPIPQPSQDNSWDSGPQQPSASGPSDDWTKKAAMYSKELSEKSEIKPWGQTNNTEQKVEDSYGTGASDSYYNNSSSSNRHGSRSCHNCGQEGHMAHECPDKKQGKGCFKCGKEGHRARDCTDESGGSYGGGYGGGKPCHKCGKEGHFARDCTDESGGSYGGGYGGGRPCHKCGKEGHFARDCTEDSGGSYGGGFGKNCRNCGKEGHFARDCKEDAREDGGYGGGNCYKCQRPGHRASECTEEPERSREFNNSLSRPYTSKPSPFSNPEPSNISSQEAWEKLLKAADENDAFDFKEALELYAKVTPDETFVSIEKKLRAANSNGRIIAFERPEIPLTKVLVDLQGNINKKYVATPILCHPSRLPRTSGNRAGSQDENLEWLIDSGFMVDDRSPVCFNCKQKGHITKDCPEPKREIEKQSYLTCQHCNSSEHMTKYCPEERRDFYKEARDLKVTGSHKGDSEYSAIDGRASGYGGEEDRKGYRGGYGSSNQTCHNCNREGHLSRDCPEPRRSGGRRCNKCGEEGHLLRDCPSGGDYDRGNYNSSGGWQRDSSSRNNDRTTNLSNKPRNDFSSQDNSWKPRGSNSSRGDNQDNKPRNDFSSQDNSWKPRGGNSSRGDYNRNDNSSQDWDKPRGGNSDYNQDNSNPWNKGRNNNDSQDNSWNKPKGGDTSQRDNQPALKVESDSWDSKPTTENTSFQNKWGNGNMTAEDLGWTKPKENITSASENYENVQRERTPATENYDNRRNRYEQRERTPVSENYDNRRARDYEQRERTPASENYDNRRGRGYEQRDRTSDYDNRRFPRDERYNNRGPGYTNSNRTQPNDANNKSGNLGDSPWW